VEEDPSEAVPGEHPGDLHLRPIGGPAGREIADILVRVRVSDHHVLLIAGGAEGLAVLGHGQQAVHRHRRFGETRAGLEKRHDPKPRGLAAGP
jgi:hypothetical protein